MSLKLESAGFLASQRAAGRVQMGTWQNLFNWSCLIITFSLFSINAVSASNLALNFDLESSFISRPDFNNAASITQAGSDNTSIVTQAGNFNTSVNKQEGWENYILVTQVGSENNAFLSQVGDRNKASVNQKGNNNSARIEQFGDDLTNRVVQNASNQFISVRTFTTW
jgi:hypothetical protein